jgi:hypothetical protein
MTPGTEILVHALDSVGGILIMTADADTHIEFFSNITFAVSGYFSERAARENSLDHDFSMAAPAGFSDVFFVDR